MTQYRAGRENAIADTLSRSHQDPAPEEEISQEEMQVAAVMTGGDITALLKAESDPSQIQDHYGTE